MHITHNGIKVALFQAILLWWNNCNQGLARIPGLNVKNLENHFAEIGKKGSRIIANLNIIFWNNSGGK